jgi:hypothetical protein
LYRRLGGPQGRSGQVRKISHPPGFDPRTVQPVASSYTDCASRPILLSVAKPNSGHQQIMNPFLCCLSVSRQLPGLTFLNHRKKENIVIAAVHLSSLNNNVCSNISTLPMNKHTKRKLTLSVLTSYIYRMFTKEWCCFKNLLNDYILQLDGVPPIFTEVYESYSIVFANSVGSDVLQMETTTYTYYMGRIRLSCGCVSCDPACTQ